MGTIEIGRGDWKPFFDDFSRQHDGWFVTVEMLTPEYGDQIEVDDLPLHGITVETANGERLEITVSESGERHLTRTIFSPRHVWLKQADADTDEVLEVEAEDGITLVHFHPQIGGHVGST